MIIRKSWGEFGHCDNCNYDFNSEELWEENLLKCPSCGEQMYEDNVVGPIPEDID